MLFCMVSKWCFVHCKLVLLIVFTHAGCLATSVGRPFSCICLSVCLSVCPRSKRKTAWNNELSTPNLVHIYSIVVAQHALTQRSRSHAYENRYGRMVASATCCYGRVRLLLAWVCMSIWLPMFSSVLTFLCLHLMMQNKQFVESCR